MKRLLICCLVAPALALAACGSDGGGINSAGTAAPPAGSPAAITGLAGTATDDKAVSLAFDGLDFARTTIDGLVALGKVVPGTPTALKLASGLDATRDWLNAARSAQRAGEASNYAVALDQAGSAMAQLKAGIAAAKGVMR